MSGAGEHEHVCATSGHACDMNVRLPLIAHPCARAHHSRMSSNHPHFAGAWSLFDDKLDICCHLEIAPKAGMLHVPAHACAVACFDSNLLRQIV